MSMNQPSHRYMVTLATTFKNANGGGGMKYINTMISRPKKTLPLVFLKQSQDSVAMQLQYFGIQPDDIVDVTVLSVSYLGHMTEREFTEGLNQKEAASMDLADGPSDGPVKTKTMFDA